MIELADAARKLLEPEAGGGITSKHVADRAARACQQLASHLARLVGEHGIQTLFKRSVILTSAQHAWLADAAHGPDSDECCASLRTFMEAQDPATATEGFVAVFTTLLGLLMRLIGEGLVRRLLYEVWPATFPQSAEESR